ncbi:MAG: hypothetical protein JJT95_13760 [Pararhodobacter sp.]|nr:hypothetical protein [Pararhodobacter sp.]
MTAPLPRPWPKARVLEARAVIADVAHHSDHLVRLACNVLTRHGETEAERRDARALLFAIDARCPARHRHAQRADHDDAPEVQR